MIGVDYEDFNNRQFKECCHIHLPSLTITLTPPKDKILNDKKFNRYMQSKNFDFINDYYIFKFFFLTFFMQKGGFNSGNITKIKR